jgi:hypothetical protein
VAEMKGLSSSIIAFLFFVSLISLGFVMSEKSAEYADVVNLHIVSSRIFEKYSSIENAILDILNKELSFGAFSVKVYEGSQFNIVKINVTLPSEAADFKDDLDNFETFAETKFNETNIVVELNTSEIQNCFPLSINPYNITFGTIEQGGQCGFGSGQRDFKVTPNGNSHQFVNSYEFRIVVNSSLNPGSADFSPASACNDGTLNWTVIIIGLPQTFGPETRMIDPSGKCTFRINAAGGGGRILNINNKPNNDDPNKAFILTVQPGFEIDSEITLNLTDIPGRITVGLPPQAIKVRETLFQVERNNTITIK